MLTRLKGYLIGVAGLALLILLIVNLVGLHLVHKKMSEVQAMKLDTSAEGSFQQVNARLTEAVQKIDQNGTDSAARLKEILNAAQTENPERSQQASPTTAKAVPSKPVQKANNAVAPNASIPKAAPGEVANGPSATTVDTVDELWRNYCANFPTASSCNRQTTGQGSVPPSPPAR